MLNIAKIFKKSVSKAVNVKSPNDPATTPNDTLEKNYLTISKEGFQKAVSFINEGVLILNEEFSVVVLNSAMEKMVGYAFNELQDKPLDGLIEFTDQNNQKLTLQKICQSISSTTPNQSVYTAILNISSKENPPIKVEVKVQPIPDENNQNKFIVVMRDLSKEAAFEQMQIDFVSMASHEFRTPLTSINNYLAVIQEEAASKLSKEQKEYLDRTIESVKVLIDLVNNLLNVSKIERQSFSVNLQPINWTERLQKIVEDCQIQASKKNIKVTLKIPTSALPAVSADDLRINEVLNNLISNAINYTPEGGHITIGANVEKNEMITYVADNGVGIAPQIIPNLFKKFYRAPGSLEQMNKGSGLGLFISKSIIDLHQGKMWVESTVGKGSTFYFSLPLSNKNAGPTIVDLPLKPS